MKKNRNHKSIKHNVHMTQLLMVNLAFNISMLVLPFPLFNFVLKQIIILWGKSYITLENLLSFILFPPTMILMIISGFLFCLCNVLKQVTLTSFAMKGITLTPREFLPEILWNLQQAISMIRKQPNLLFYGTLQYISLNLPIMIGLSIYIKIPSAYKIGKDDDVFIRGLILFILILLYFISISYSFTFHNALCHHNSLDFSIEKTKQFVRNHRKKIMWRLIPYNLAVVLLLHLLYYIILIITAILVYFFAEKRMAITVFLSLYPKINTYALIALAILSYLLNIRFFTKLYIQLLDIDDIKQPLTSLHPHSSKTPMMVSNHISIFYSLVLVTIVFGLINFARTIQYSSFHIQNSLSRTSIASHRGYSMVAPENTLPAIEAAIDSRSEYAEVDLQLSKDGNLVLMHDRSLYRTTGVKKDISSMTLDQLKTLDAGSWFGDEFSNTTIPTLAEAIELAQGRIKLNLHVKSYQKDDDLINALIQIIDETEFEEQCIISSTSYPLLQGINARNPNLKLGLILSSYYTNYIREDFIDFYSIRSSYINKSMVERIHLQGKEIHGWTVNSPTEIERMKSISVDCIITDNPLLTREILYRDDTTEPFISLIEKMLANRSFYNITRVSN